ncbi:hypothetical protein Vretifemale_7623, partial [Volvox reticuliferus]
PLPEADALLTVIDGPPPALHVAEKPSLVQDQPQRAHEQSRPPEPQPQLQRRPSTQLSSVDDIPREELTPSVIAAARVSSSSSSLASLPTLPEHEAVSTVIAVAAADGGTQPP